jgi:hypothetical protein
MGQRGRGARQGTSERRVALKQGVGREREVEGGGDVALAVL